MAIYSVNARNRVISELAEMDNNTVVIEFADGGEAVIYVDARGQINVGPITRRIPNRNVEDVKPLPTHEDEAFNSIPGALNL